MEKEGFVAEIDALCRTENEISRGTIDLFSGCGGLSMGFGEAGFEVLAAFDNWEPAISVYRENFDHPIFEQDLRDTQGACNRISAYEPDVLIGGPPCQDFSSAGLRNPEGGRADLTYSFADIVEEILPETFVMENVEQIRKSHILVDIISRFWKAGYGLTAVILDASYCGAPQARRRFFLVGHLDDCDDFLMPSLMDRMSECPMTMRDYFGDSLGTEYYYRHPRNYDRRAIYSLDEPSATIRGVNRPIPPGYKLHRNDAVGASLSQARPLTSIERAQVQTFPPNFKFLGTKTAMEQMIGNAVPVALARFVAGCLYDYLSAGEFGGAEDGRLFHTPMDLVPMRPLHRVREFGKKV